MKRSTKLLLILLIIVFGWLIAGFGFTTKLEHPVNTICFIFGFVQIIIGIVFFIKIVKEK